MSIPKLHEIKSQLSLIAPYIKQLADRSDIQTLLDCASDFLRLRTMYGLFAQTTVLTESYEDLYLRMGKIQLQNYLMQLIRDKFELIKSRFIADVQYYYTNSHHLFLSAKRVLLNVNLPDMYKISNQVDLNYVFFLFALFGCINQVPDIEAEFKQIIFEDKKPHLVTDDASDAVEKRDSQSLVIQKESNQTTNQTNNQQSDNSQPGQHQIDKQKIKSIIKDVNREDLELKMTQIRTFSEDRVGHNILDITSLPFFNMNLQFPLLQNQIESVQIEDLNQVLSLVKAYSELKTFNVDLLKKVQEHQSQKQTFVKQIQDKITFLNTELKEKTESNVQICTELSNVKSDLIAREKAIMTFQIENKSLKSDLTKTKQLLSTSEQHNYKFKSELEQLQSTSNDSNILLNRLQIENKQKTDQIHALSAELNQIKSIYAQNVPMIQTAQNIKQKFQIQTQQLQKLLFDNEQHKTHQKELEQNQIALKNQSQLLQQQNIQLKTSIKTKQNQIDNLTQALDSKTHELNVQTEINTKFKIQTNQLLNENEQLNKTLNKTQKDLKEAINQQQNTVNELNQTQKLNQTQRDLSLTQSIKHINTEQNELDNLNAKISNLKQINAELEHNVQMLRTDSLTAQQYKNQITELQKEVNKQINLNNVIQNQTEQLKSKQDQLIDYKKQINQLNNAIEYLNNQLKEANNNNQLQQQQIAQINATLTENTDLKNQLLTQKSNYDQAQNQIQQEKLKYNLLQEQLIKLNLKFHELEKQVTDNELQNKYDRLLQKVKQLEEENYKLQLEDTDKLDSDSEELKEVDILRVENQKLTEQIEFHLAPQIQSQTTDSELKNKIKLLLQGDNSQIEQNILEMSQMQIEAEILADTSFVPKSAAERLETLKAELEKLTE
ncbi:Conserved_hypothetical protein [Hexamita inflata]|uniref:Uncharacterized protein n=1 Tax=Hexamita inflata TaxID=28002 RepID=A0AA86PDZ0_9EUKA|nr:Conserved hypothetical protein [Hexamita inflata]